MVNVTMDLVGLTRAEGPLVASAEHDRGVLEIQEREADTIDRSAGSEVGAVVQDEPAVRGLDRWRSQADLACVLPGAVTRL